MTQGPGRPGQPGAGQQRSIFGGGAPMFQMPVYTPVTRGPAPAAPQPAPIRPQEPAQPDYSAYAAPSAPSYPDNSYPGESYSNGNYANGAYANGGYAETPSYDPHAPAYNGYASEPQAGAPSYEPLPQPTAAGYAQNGYSQNGYQQDASFETPGDASFGEPQFEDAGFDSSFSATDPYGHEEPLTLDTPAAAYAPQGYAPQHDMRQPYAPPSGASAAQHGDPHRAVASYDAPYNEGAPQVALGYTEQPHAVPTGYREGERVDAGFLDDKGQPPAAAIASRFAKVPKFAMNGRSMFMLGSVLLGALALGGALAFVYKQSGGGVSNGQAPIIEADNRPVKEAPDQVADDADSKDASHKGKLIYDRLQGDNQAETDHLVPRQEDLAMPAMPGAGPAQAAGPVDAGAAQTADAGGAQGGPGQVASVDDPANGGGGPRRVKTMVVKPDGSMASADAAPAPDAMSAQDPNADMTTAAAPPADPDSGAGQGPAPDSVADAAPPAPVAPAPRARPTRVASAAADDAATGAKPRATHRGNGFVVQVGSKKNQTEALASFADMQQKYPTLLANYRPMVQKADLGSKGTWYRLRIGPINDKSSASKLCSQLRSQGMSDCLVMTQ